jgi:amino acid transporter
MAASQTQANPGTIELERHFGLWHATALNVSMIVGSGVFITIPFMLKELPGPMAIWGWILGGALMIVDGMIWSELGAAFPGSGGSYLYLLESFGRQRLGRLLAFLFVWQFLISGPMELASALISMAVFSSALGAADSPFFAAQKIALVPALGLDLIVSPARLASFGVGVLIVLLLYRRITTLGRLALVIWFGVLGMIAWILLDGACNFESATAWAPGPPSMPWSGLGKAMALAMYSYLGYYNVCYFGDEVRTPGRTIPRAILLSAVLVCILFVGLHAAMLGTVPWAEAVAQLETQKDGYNLPADFMARLHGHWAAVAVTLLLIWSCFGSAFAGLLGYSRIPYGAARHGHFFSALARVHPVHKIPHVSLLMVGGLTLFWSFFDLEKVIQALITTRILEQFVAQVLGVMWLRRSRPDMHRPYRIWFYPLPCLLALVGWIFMYATSDILFILWGAGTLLAGVVVFIVWSHRIRAWPFRRERAD